MMILGLRCSNSGYTFAVLSGSRKSPAIIAKGSVDTPKGFAKPQKLRWMAQEMHDLCKRHNITCIAMKGTEGLASRGSSFVERIEIEAAVFMSGAELGIKPVVKKVKSTIAKDLGQKGKAKYLERIDTSIILNFSDYNEHEKEAVFVAWSEM